MPATYSPIRRHLLSVIPLLISLLLFPSPAYGYDLIREYTGSNFFDGWDFFGSWDNLTLGDVWWLDKDDAFNQGLAFVNNAGRAVIRVDNSTNVPFNEKRNSVRITTKDSYSVGSLWIADFTHIPSGCGVWPAFWSKGPDWPFDGEIDIIEAINQMPANQMALHTTSGCFKGPAPQSGVLLESDCSTAAGCTVGETKPNSYGDGFTVSGGGVWATQFDVSGIFIWFWSRANIPNSILTATDFGSIDVSDFGMPSASYPAVSCNIPQFFTAQQLVLDITLCGQWAGLGTLYAPACGGQGRTGICYNDMVVGDGSKFNDAYFEISYLRAYTTGGATPTVTPVVPVQLQASTLTTTITAAGTTATIAYTNAGNRAPNAAESSFYLSGAGGTAPTNAPSSGGTILLKQSTALRTFLWLTFFLSMILRDWTR